MLHRTFSKALFGGQGKGRDGIAALSAGKEASRGNQAVVAATRTLIDLHELLLN